MRSIQVLLAGLLVFNAAPAFADHVTTVTIKSAERMKDKDLECPERGPHYKFIGDSGKTVLHMTCSGDLDNLLPGYIVDDPKARSYGNDLTPADQKRLASLVSSLRHGHAAQISYDSAGKLIRNKDHSIRVTLSNAPIAQNEWQKGFYKQLYLMAIRPADPADDSKVVTDDQPHRPEAWDIGRPGLGGPATDPVVDTDKQPASTSGAP